MYLVCIKIDGQERSSLVLVSQMAWQILFGEHLYRNAVVIDDQNAALRSKPQIQLAILGIEQTDAQHGP